MRAGDHGADFDVVAGLGLADHQGADLPDQVLGELFGHGLVHQDAAGSAAVLAGVPEPGIADTGSGGAEVGVGEDDNRSLAAEFQVDALDGLRGGFGHGLAADDAARQGHEVNVGVFGESLPHSRGRGR